MQHPARSVPARIVPEHITDKGMCIELAVKKPAERHNRIREIHASGFMPHCMGAQ